MKYDEKNQSEAWKNGVARDLNVLLVRADYYSDQGENIVDVDAEVVAAIHSIVNRVAEFEGIATK